MGLSGHQRNRSIAGASAAVCGVFVVLAVMIERGESLRSIEWRTLDSARVEAQITGKLIYLDVYADWCGPCKKMEKTVFINDSVKFFLQSSFIPARLDIDDPSVKEFIEKQLRINAVPTSIVMNSEGVELARHVGFMNKEQLLEWLEGSTETALPDWSNFQTARRQSKRLGKPLAVIVLRSGHVLDRYSRLFRDPLVERTLQEEFVPSLLVATSPTQGRIADSLHVFTGLPSNVTAVVLLIAHDATILGRVPLTEMAIYDGQSFANTLLSYKD